MEFIRKLIKFFKKPQPNDGVIWLLETPYRNY